MNRTKIDWCDYTWNPITGCSNNCPYCYARKIAKRFPKHFPNGFKPTYHRERIDQPTGIKKPAKIFVCSMGEFFDPNVHPSWQYNVINTIWYNQRHQFLLLTKHLIGLKYFLERYSVLPSNLWLGVSIEGESQSHRWAELVELASGKGCHLWISFEPLLEPVHFEDWFKRRLYYMSLCEWVVIGAQTNPYRLVPEEWVIDIAKPAKEHLIPVFMKENLLKDDPTLHSHPISESSEWWLREYPKEMKGDSKDAGT